MLKTGVYIDHPACLVRCGAWSRVGVLYLITRDHVVLLNNTIVGLEYGKIQKWCSKQVVPEVQILVIPKETVDSISLLGQFEEGRLRRTRRP